MQQPSAVAGNATAGEPILIGIATGQSGVLAPLGQEIVSGAQVAETYFNERGGVNGRPIKLVVQDTGSDTPGAITATTTLINNYPIVAMIGPLSSGQTLATGPLAEQVGLPMLSASATAKGIPQIGEYVGRVSSLNAYVLPNAVTVALSINPNVKNVMMLYAKEDASNRSEIEVFGRTITETYDLNLAAVQTFPPADTDFSQEAASVMEVQPDLVIISSIVATGGALIKALRDAGYDGLIIGGNGLNSPALFSVCQAQCDGVLIAQAYSNEEPIAINQAFREAYKTAHNADPLQFSAQAFTAVQVFVETLQAIDSQTPLQTLPLDQQRAELNQQMLSRTYTSPLGDISFTPDGELRKGRYYAARLVVDPEHPNGAFTFVTNDRRRR
jgi:branched-chain amino acid transport system substrate-binding protein